MGSMDHFKAELFKQSRQGRRAEVLQMRRRADHTPASAAPPSQPTPNVACRYSDQALRRQPTTCLLYEKVGALKVLDYVPHADQVNTVAGIWLFQKISSRDVHLC